MFHLLARVKVKIKVTKGTNIFQLPLKLSYEYVYPTTGTHKNSSDSKYCDIMRILIRMLYKLC